MAEFIWSPPFPTPAPAHTIFRQIAAETLGVAADDVEIITRHHGPFPNRCRRRREPGDLSRRSSKPKSRRQRCASCFSMKPQKPLAARSRDCELVKAFSVTAPNKNLFCRVSCTRRLGRTKAPGHSEFSNPRARVAPPVFSPRRRRSKSIRRPASNNSQKCFPLMTRAR